MGAELRAGADQADRKFSELQLKTKLTSVLISRSFSLQQIGKRSTPQTHEDRKWAKLPSWGVTIALI